MDLLGTITHDYETPWRDKMLEYSRNHPQTKEQMNAYKYMYRGHSALNVNPLWHRAFGGREEYT